MDKMNLLFSKKQYLSQFYNLVIKEKDCLVNEEWQKADNIIRAKEVKIGKINRINEKLSQFTGSDNQEVREAEREISGIVREIKRIEDKNIAMVKEKMKESKEELKEIKMKQKVNLAYLKAESRQQGGYFIDKFK